MKIKTASYALLATILLASSNGNAQTDKYSLLTEPFVERPVSMHKGQLQVNGAYQLSVTTGYFDETGNKVNLVEDGRAAVGHKIYFNAHYGILEFLEVGAEMNHFKQGIRSRTHNYFDTEGSLRVTELTEYKGFEDLILSATVRLPVYVKLFDIGITGYYLLPVSEHEPGKPDHTLEIDIPEAGWNTIDYRYNENNGTGIPMIGAGGIFKIRLPKFALVGRGSFLLPQKEGETHFWESELIDDDFIYEQIDYAFLPQYRFQGTLTAHVQPIGWLNIFLEGNYNQNTGGWFEQNNQRYAYPENRLLSILLGFEIQVSPGIRILEYTGFPLSGENNYADFFIYTGLSFNLITH